MICCDHNVAILKVYERETRNGWHDFVLASTAISEAVLVAKVLTDRVFNFLEDLDYYLSLNEVSHVIHSGSI